MKYPAISIILPTFNEEKRIEKCLTSIRKQNYPKNKIELIVVDDRSKDKTVEIARVFGAKVISSGTHHIERSKSLGLEKALNEYIFFIDADNVLTSDNWFRDCIKIFNKNREVVGVQSLRFLYKKNDTLPNRYCALFGINDPFVYYLGKRGLLKTIENKWLYSGTLLKEDNKYFLVNFNLDNLPTVGSQGYMTKKSLLLKTDWKPYFFHLDSVYDLVSLGYTQFAFIKYDIEHDYSDTFVDMFKKLRRNIVLYLKYRKLRRYKYRVNPLKYLLIIIAMSTFIIPLIDSFRGYFKKKDPAWFLHPIICFGVVIIYSFETFNEIFLDGGK